MINIRGFKTINIINSNIFAITSGGSTSDTDVISVYNDKQNIGVYVRNSILQAKHFVRFNSLCKVAFMNFFETVLSETIEDFFSTPPPGTHDYQTLSYISYNADEVQESWTSPIDSVPDTSATNEFNYLLNKWNITLSGDSGYPTEGLEWFDGQRDGVGSFYFEQPIVNLSGTSVSGSVPLSASFSISATSANSANEEIVYSFGDGYTSAINALTVNYTYNTIGTFSADAILTSKNGWYETASNTILVNALDTISATFNMYDKSTSAVITSAYTYQDIFLSGTVVVGDITQYSIDFDDEEIENIFVIDNSIYYEYKYKSSGSKTIKLRVLNDEGQSHLEQQNFTVYDAPATTYYVDLDENYISSEVNIGTSADPFNYNEFYNYVKTSGTAGNKDIFKLKNNIILTISAGESKPWTAFETDPDKSFTLDAWNLTEYGPWMIIVQDYDTNDNAIIAFKGSTLKNGIIYNAPITIGGTRYGGTLYISYIYNMFIVNQGINSNFYVHADNYVSGVCIKGSTIYSYNGFRESTSLSAYNFIIEDSVIAGFNNKTQEELDENTNGNLYLYNSTVDLSENDVLSDYNGAETSGCQFNWTIPTSQFPLLKQNGSAYGYLQSIDWIMLRKNIFQPFSSITAPPNPGKNYDVYRNYTTGLFGVSRKDYVR